jgi:hypothetical protein
MSLRNAVHVFLWALLGTGIAILILSVNRWELFSKSVSKEAAFLQELARPIALELGWSDVKVLAIGESDREAAARWHRDRFQETLAEYSQEMAAIGVAQSFPPWQIAGWSDLKRPSSWGEATRKELAFFPLYRSMSSAWGGIEYLVGGAVTTSFVVWRKSGGIWEVEYFCRIGQS